MYELSLNVTDLIQLLPTQAMIQNVHSFPGMHWEREAKPVSSAYRQQYYFKSPAGHLLLH